MYLIAWIRALITTLVLASYSPLGLAIDHGEPDSGQVGHLAISLFIGRRTRVAASQQFNVTNSANYLASGRSFAAISLTRISRIERNIFNCPSRTIFSGIFSASNSSYNAFAAGSIFSVNCRSVRR